VVPVFTSSCIERALAESDANDDNAAVAALRGRTGGMPNWETAMASVVLAACRPGLYMVVDSRALRTLMLRPKQLGQPPSAVAVLRPSLRAFSRPSWGAEEAQEARVIVPVVPSPPEWGALVQPVAGVERCAAAD
jgi:hypothetical protein